MFKVVDTTSATIMNIIKPNIKLNGTKLCRKKKGQPRVIRLLGEVGTVLRFVLERRASINYLFLVMAPPIRGLGFYIKVSAFKTTLRLL